MTDIKESLNDSEIIGLVIPDIAYDEKLVEVAGNISKNYDNILYISIDKPFDKLVDKFKKNKINCDNFHFIDCITHTLKKPEPCEKCTYVSSPRAFDEVHGAISDVLKKREIDIVLIDSPSSLLTYYERMDVLKFIHILMIKLLTANCKGIFPFPRESGESFKRSVEMFTDKVVYLPDEIPGSNANPDLSRQNFSEISNLLLIVPEIALIFKSRLMGFISRCGF